MERKFGPPVNAGPDADAKRIDSIMGSFETVKDLIDKNMCGIKPSVTTLEKFNIGEPQPVEQHDDEHITLSTDKQRSNNEQIESNDNANIEIKQTTISKLLPNMPAKYRSLSVDDSQMRDMEKGLEQQIKSLSMNYIERLDYGHEMSGFDMRNMPQPLQKRSLSFNSLQKHEYEQIMRKQCLVQPSYKVEDTLPAKPTKSTAVDKYAEQKKILPSTKTKHNADAEQSYEPFVLKNFHLHKTDDLFAPPTRVPPNEESKRLEIILGPHEIAKHYMQPRYLGIVPEQAVLKNPIEARLMQSQRYNPKAIQHKQHQQTSIASAASKDSCRATTSYNDKQLKHKKNKKQQVTAIDNVATANTNIQATQQSNAAAHAKVRTKKVMKKSKNAEESINKDLSKLPKREQLTKIKNFDAILTEEELMPSTSLAAAESRKHEKRKLHKTKKQDKHKSTADVKKDDDYSKWARRLHKPTKAEIKKMVRAQIKAIHADTEATADDNGISKKTHEQQIPQLQDQTNGQTIEQKPASKAAKKKKAKRKEIVERATTDSKKKKSKKTSRKSVGEHKKDEQPKEP